MPWNGTAFTHSSDRVSSDAMRFGCAWCCNRQRMSIVVHVMWAMVAVIRSCRLCVESEQRVMLCGRTAGKYLLVKRHLHDEKKQYAMQSRSGCACAGPYTGLLLDPLLDRLGVSGASLDASLIASHPGQAASSVVPCHSETWLKAGFCRVYFSHFMRPQEVDYVIQAVGDVAQFA